MLPKCGRWRPADARLVWSHTHDEKRARRGFPPALSVRGFGSPNLNLGLANALRGGDAYRRGASTNPRPSSRRL